MEAVARFRHRDGNGDGDGDRVFGLMEMQGAGFEVGTVVEDLESVGEEELVRGYWSVRGSC